MATAGAATGGSRVVRDSELEEEDIRNWVDFSSLDAAKGAPALGSGATRLTRVGTSVTSGLHPARPGLDLARLGSLTLVLGAHASERGPMGPFQ